MEMNQVLVVTSNTATVGTTTTTRMTGVATVTKTTGVATDITTTGVATVATKRIDGDGTDILRISVKAQVLHKFLDSLLKIINHVEKFTSILRLFVHDLTSLKIW